MESIELGYIIEPPRARVKTIALKSKESKEEALSLITAMEAKQHCLKYAVEQREQ